MPLPLEIDVASVAALQQEGEPFLFLDCRREDEHAIAAIPGTELIPMHELGDRLDELEPHRQSRIVVHCHHGMRSLQVAAALREAGFEQAQSMAGGIDDWSERIDPSIPRY